MTWRATCGRPCVTAVGSSVSWESAVGAGLVHVAVVGAAVHPRTILPALALLLCVHTLHVRRPATWTLLGRAAQILGEYSKS